MVFRCPACGRDLEAPTGTHGRVGACMFCGAQITAPVAPGASSGFGPGTYTFGAKPPAAEPWFVSQPTGGIDPGQILVEVWAYLKRYWATLLAAQLITEVVSVGVLGVILIGAMLLQPEGTKQAGPTPSGANPSVLLFTVVLLVELLAYPIGLGPLYHAHHIVARGDTSMSGMFGWVRNYGALVACLALLALPLLPFALLMYAAQRYAPEHEYLLVIIAIMGLAMFTFVLVSLGLSIMEVIDKGSDAVSALRASWTFTQGHRWAILGTALLIYVVSMAGMFACYLGLFFTMNAIPLGIVIVYRHLRGLQGTPDA